MSVFDAGLDAFVDRLERALDVMSERQQLTASNIANLDTPRYRTVDIDFNTALAEAMNETTGRTLPRTTRPGHISAGDGAGKIDPREVSGLTTRNDGNNVNLDREMMALAQTRLRYEVSTTLARMKMSQIRAAIDDRS